MRTTVPQTRQAASPVSISSARRAGLAAAIFAGALGLTPTHAQAQTCALPEQTAGTTQGVYGSAWGRDTSATAGSLLGCRQVDGTSFWTNPSKTAPSYVARIQRAIAFRYVTTDAGGRKVPATGTLLVPATVPSINLGKAPLIALGTGTAGVSDACTPSRTIRGDAGLLGNNIDFYLSKGLTVVVVDYIGLGTQLGAPDGDSDDHPYLEGPSAGHVMLDALRAARKVPGGHYANANATVPSSWPVAVEGYSQGGSASQWAALLAKDYAPELPVAGAIVGAPAIDLRATIEKIDSSLFRSLYGMAFLALTNATDPSTKLTRAELDNLLTPTGQDLVARMRTTCAVQLGTQTLVDVLFGNYHLDDLLNDKNLDNFWSIPAVARFVQQNSVKPAGLLNFPTRPSVPVFGYHGMVDDVNPYGLHRDVMLNAWGATEGGTTLGADAALARSNYAFQSIAFASHATASSLERNDTNLNDRYAPIEWVWDSLFGALRSWPDLTTPF